MQEPAEEEREDAREDEDPFAATLGCTRCPCGRLRHEVLGLGYRVWGLGFRV